MTSNASEKNTAEKNRENNLKDLSKLPDDAVIRLPDVLRLHPISAAGWWKGIKDGRYPKPVKLGPRARGWRIGDVLALTSQQ